MASTQETAENLSAHKKLTELKVADLKSELEKRNKDKNGVKQVLVERLAAALTEEGHDPADYLFPAVDASKSTPKKKATPAKMSLKDKEEERDSDLENSESSNINKEEGEKAETKQPSNAHSENKLLKPGLEAADIVQDALQLDVDDELNEDRDNDTSGSQENMNTSSKTASEDKNASEKHDKRAIENGASPPKPETVPVVAPLTVDDTVSLDTSCQRKGEDDVSMVVNVDDTQSELDGDTSVTTTVDSKSKKESSSKSEDRKTSRSESKKESTKEKSDKDTKDSSPKENEAKNSSKGKTSSSKDPRSLRDKKSGSIPTRNVWVSNISQETRASDLQTLFKKHGKVIAAKIITNTKIPGSRLYGLITMETAEQAEKCINDLNKTELNGKKISLGKSRPQENVRPIPIRKDRLRDKEGRRKDIGDDDKRRRRSRSGSKSPRPFVRRLPLRRPFGVGMRRSFGGRFGPSNVGMRGGHVHRPTFGRPMDGDRFKPRERDFIDRERRQAELARQDAERKAREERERLEREKEKLRIERERLERDKAELLRIERERARQEREKIEREREEIAARRRQAQMTSQLDSMRGRPISSVTTKRPYDGRDSDIYFDERKRTAGIASQVSLAPRTFEQTSRFPSEFDSRNSGTGFEPRSNEFVKRESFTNRGNDYERRDSRHGGHDRDDRRSGVANTGGSSGYRDIRTPLPSRERDRRPAGGRDDWKSHDNRRDRYDKGISGGSSNIYTSGTNTGGRGSFGGGGDREIDWGMNDRNSTAPGVPKISYDGGSALDSRSRAPTGLNPSIMAGNAMGSMFQNTTMPMTGMIPHNSMQTSTNMSSGYRDIHTVGRRF